MSDDSSPADWWSNQTTLCKGLIIAVPVGLALVVLVAIIVVALRTSRPAPSSRRRSAAAVVAYSTPLY
jgi:hypothetical protein